MYNMRIAQHDMRVPSIVHPRLLFCAVKFGIGHGRSVLGTKQFMQSTPGCFWFKWHLISHAVMGLILFSFVLPQSSCTFSFLLLLWYAVKAQSSVLAKNNNRLILFHFMQINILLQLKIMRLLKLNNFKIYLFKQLWHIQ